MSSKLTLSAILYRIFEETRKWECENKIPASITPVIRDRPICYHNVWVKATVMQIKYEEFYFFIQYLKITSQKRVIRDRWNEMIKYGYITEINTSKAYVMQLNYIRPLFGQPNPTECPDYRANGKIETAEEAL